MLRLAFGTLLLWVSTGSAIATGASPLADSREEYTACVVAAVDDMIAAYPRTPTDEVLAYANAECSGITTEENMKDLEPVFRTVLDSIGHPKPAGNDFTEQETEQAADTPFAQPSQEAQASVSAPDPTSEVPVKEIQNDRLSASFDYKGIQIGGQATPELVTEKLGISCGAGFGNAQVCNGFSTIAGASASINLVISGDGRVLRMLLTFPSNDFNAVEAAMLSKYGKPSMATNSDVQNGYGAQFQQRDVIWKDGSNFLSLSRYAGRITEGIAYYSAEGDPMRQSRSQPDDL